MDQGWSLKKLQRLIVTSNTYKQSSHVTPELLEKDPYNRLLARGPRFRVDAEIVRDIALSASGLLDPEIGGPSVFPPAPGFPLPASGQLRPEGLDRIRRGRALSPRHLHVPLPFRSLSHAGNVRCAER